MLLLLIREKNQNNSVLVGSNVYNQTEIVTLSPRLTFILFGYLFINALVSGDIVDNRLMFIMLALFIRERLSLQKIPNE